MKHNAGQFYPWEGVDDGLATYPLTKVIKPRKSSTPKRSTPSSIKQITPVSGDHSDDSTSTTGLQNRLRKRTARQE